MPKLKNTEEAMWGKIKSKWIISIHDYQRYSFTSLDREIVYPTHKSLLRLKPGMLWRGRHNTNAIIKITKEGHIYYIKDHKDIFSQDVGWLKKVLIENYTPEFDPKDYINESEITCAPGY